MKIIAESTFRNETMDMRIPFKIPAKSMENTDETRCIKFRLIVLVEKPEHNRLDGRKEAVKKLTIFEKKDTKWFCNRKDTVTVRNIDHLERHGHGTVHGIFVTTSGTESGVAAKRNKFEQTTLRTAVHSTAVSSIPTMNHFFNGFHDNRTGM